MYDLEGKDDKREWIEVYNSSAQPIDISTWKFFENGTNHGLTLMQGDGNLPAGAAAIIVSNFDKFIIDWPSFGGIVFDSSFSLSNTGETLTIRDSDLVDIDSVSYLSDWGGKGDGNSLQRVDGSWSGLSPNPGEYDSGEETPVPVVESSSGNDAPTVNFPVGEISVKTRGEDVVLVGADTLFEAEGYGVVGEPLENARYAWNFGDGTLKEGKRVMHHYDYPGQYVVFLDVSSHTFSVSDRLYIEAKSSELIISEVDNSEGKFIKLLNPSSEELNISWWRLRAGDEYFSFPQNTFILPNKELTLSSEITKLDSRRTPLQLLYPNGIVAYGYVKKPFNPISTNSSPVIERITENSPAAVILSEDPNLETKKEIPYEKKGVLWKWVLALLGLIALSLGVFFYLGKNGSTID